MVLKYNVITSQILTIISSLLLQSFTDWMYVLTVITREKRNNLKMFCFVESVHEVEQKVCHVPDSK